jgi:hypothetical protein
MPDLDTEHSPTLELRSIGQLLSERFVIPSYQRGYRWTERQVTELLDDLYEFQRTSDQRPREAFYCLQPVVVRQHHDEHGNVVPRTWELIDGQQRLTTIRLILNALKDGMQFFRKKPFLLKYESRPLSEGFLDNLEADRSGENIDFFHLYNAHKAILSWFDNHDAARLNMLNCLISPEERNVKVIWYQLPPAEAPIEAFIRLNVGKIPLTNGELIRAVLLKQNATGRPSTLEGRIQIAHEWDSLEKQLRDETFWHFIHRGPSPYPARIEYLFAIRVQELGLAAPQHDDYATFLAYDAHVRATSANLQIDDHWREIRHLYQRLDEWRNDRELFHLVGYLVATATEPSRDLIVKLLGQRKNSTRSEFVRHLRSTICLARFNVDLTAPEAPDARTYTAEHLDQLSYAAQSNRDEIRALLLLMNVATILHNPSSDVRFQFHHYANEPWDLEHIRSVKSDMPGRADDQKAWLGNVIDYWGDGQVDEATERLRATAEGAVAATPFEVRAFPGLYEEILDHFGEVDDSEVNHGISNIVLLDRHTNRGYKNAVFPIKRRYVIDLDRSATYVPVCTTNVFLKYYSQNVDNMLFWTREDAQDYRSAMINTMLKFFKGGN